MNGLLGRGFRDSTDLACARACRLYSFDFGEGLSMKARKLSRREFARAIKLGLGRAVLHVRDYGDKGIEDILKEAMLCNYVFDLQFESDRCLWLYSMLCHTGRLRYYVEYFYKKINGSTPSEFDMRQQVVLAGIFFSAGFVEFRPIILDFGLKLSACKRFNITGACELFDIAGVFGFEIAVKEICRAEPDLLRLGYECNQIYEHAETGSRKDLDKVLARLEEQEPDLKRFRESVAAFKDDSTSDYKKERPKLTLKDLLLIIEEQIETKGAYSSRRFGKYATADELDYIFKLLLKEGDWTRQHCYLSVFDSRVIPKISEGIFEFLDSPHHRVRHACATALSNSVSVKIRKKALKMLRASEEFKIPLALTLLKKNYLPSDAPEIVAALKRMKDPIQIHSAGNDVEDIYDAGSRPELMDCFFWLYENGPESWCRYGHLERLIKAQVCPDEILFEAQWDSGDEVQALARSILARREVGEQGIEL